MKRLTTNSTSGRRLILPVLAVLALTVLSLPTDADAGIRIRVKTPVVQAVYVSGGHQPGLRIQVPGSYRPVKITNYDRKVARKISRRTDYSQGDLLRLRGAGYTWREVGRLLHIPQPLMSKALKAKGGSNHGYGIGRAFDDDQDVRVIYKNR